MDHNYSTKRIDGRPPAPEHTQMFAHIERNLYTAVISDALDQVGIRDRVMYEQLRPINPDSVFAGWARTVSCVDMYGLAREHHQRRIDEGSISVTRVREIRGAVSGDCRCRICLADTRRR